MENQAEINSRVKRVYNHAQAMLNEIYEIQSLSYDSEYLSDIVESILRNIAVCKFYIEVADSITELKVS